MKLIDQSGQILATALVSYDGTTYGGTIDLESIPPELCAHFEEFEEIVNGQMFSFLDDVQKKIDSFPIRIMFNTGREVHIKDLQVFPGTGDVSFKLAEKPVPVEVN